MRVWSVISVFMFAACGNNTSDTVEDIFTNHGIPGTSLYNLTSEWIAQDSSVLHLEDLSGKPQVLALIYTSCQAACPRIVADMRHIESELGEDVSAVGFVLVSIDPEHDKPARLDTFARENFLDPSRWKLLYGESPDVMEVAAVLGVRYRKTTPLDYAHSNIITVLNEVGDVVYQQDGLGADPKVTVQKIRDLVNKPS